MQEQAARSTRRRLFRQGAVIAGSVTMAAGLAACGGGASQSAGGTQTSELTGTFDLLYQTWSVGDIYHKQAVEAFKQKHPRVTVSLVPVGYSDMAPKVRASIAAGSGPDGFHTYTGFWRGTNAATIMLPLTPNLIKRSELEQITFPNLLNAVWAKNNEVYVLPHSVGMNGSMLVYNAKLLANANVDAKSLTTLDAIIAAANKLVVREGGAITRAGLLPTSTTNLVMRWIIDQGGKFYDEKTHAWTWQTAEAERAFQWILDLYDKHNLAWRKQPDGIKDAMGEARSAMIIHGAYALSNYSQQYPDATLQDQPMPGFVNGKTPNYYEHEIAGYGLSALLKPDDMKARVGAAFIKDLLSPEGARALADQYSGAILSKSVYADPSFKQTKFGTVRAKLPEQIISKMVLMTMAADPGAFSAHITKVINGELSIKAALQDMQQTYSAKEEDARRTMN